MQFSIKKRVMAVAVCLCLLISASAYRPQPAEAVALTSTAAVVALVASVMTACGVTYWASTEQDAIDYLGGKLQTYIGTLSGGYSTLLEWLGITSISDAFAIMNGGILNVPMSIANKILDFVGWYNQEEGIVSGGGVISNASFATPVYSSSYINSGIFEAIPVSDNVVDVYFRNVYTNSGTGNVGVCFNILSGAYNDKIQARITEYDGTMPYNFKWSISSGTSSSPGSGSGMYSVNTTSTLTAYSRNNYYLWIYYQVQALQGFTARFRIEFTIEGGDFEETAPTVSVTPSDSVVVPPALEQGQSLVITTTASISNGDSQEEACQAILDTVVSQDGLSSSSTTGGAAVPSVWTWLYDVVRGLGDTLTDIKNGILGLPSSIASAISSALSSLFVPSEAYIGTFVASLYSTFDNHFSILSYPFSLLGTFITKCATIGGSDPILTWPDIYEPFSHKLLIPSGSYNLNNALQNQTFAYAHSLYMIVVKGIISFQFVGFLYAWFCDVFHMKNSDYDNPFDIEDETDFDDLPAGTNGSDYEDWEHDG